MIGLAVTTVQALLICNVGGPGTAAQAQPVVEQFVLQIEKTAGWEKGSLTGVYQSRRPQCESYMAQSKPTIAALDLTTYLRFQKSWKLVPIAHMGAADSKRYYLLVREGSYKNLAELKGKTLISPFTTAPVFLEKLVLGGKVKVKDHFQLQQTYRPLKGLRKVARGQADATIVDEEAYKHLKELKLPVKLVALAQSQPLPGLTLAVVGTNAAKPKALANRIAKTLPQLCTGPGESLCKTFQISAFSKAETGLYRKLQKRYDD